MSDKLKHNQIHKILTSLADAKIVNLDSSIRNLVEPIASAIGKPGAGDEVSLHILCCDEYALVTGLIDKGNIAEILKSAESVRSSM